MFYNVLCSIKDKIFREAIEIKRSRRQPPSPEEALLRFLLFSWEEVF